MCVYIHNYKHMDTFSVIHSVNKLITLMQYHDNIRKIY